MPLLLGPTYQEKKNVGYISEVDYFLLHKYFMISIFHFFPWHFITTDSY